MATKLELLYQMIEPAVTALELDLWGIEYSGQGRQSMLRVYIDADAGIGVEDCTAVSRQIGAILDVEDPIQGEYTLEVSSPGVDRPLFKLSHYEQCKGEELNLRLRYAYEDRRNFKGILQGLEGDEVIMYVDGHEYLFPFDTIEKAHIIGRIKND